MKQRFTKLMAAAFLLVTMSASPMQLLADEWSYTFNASSGISKGDNTINGVTWNIAHDSDYENNEASGYHVGSSSKSVSYLQLSTSGIQGTISQIVVNAKGNGNNGTISASVNNTSYTSSNTSITNSFQDFTFTGSSEGGIVIRLDYSSAQKKNFYVASITVTYSTGGTSTPSMSVSTNSIDFGSNPINPSEPYTETFEVTFANLTEDLIVTGFDGVMVSPATIFATETSPQTVTVSYNPTTEGNLSGSISVNSSEVTEKLVTVTGSAYDPDNLNIYGLYTEEIVEGDYVIYYDGKAMKNTVSSDRLDYVEVTPNNNAITTSNASIVWHIAQSGEYWTIYNEAVQMYAASTGAANKAKLLASGTDDKSKWTVSGTVTHEFVNKANAANSVNANLRNNGTYGFACYATGTGGALSLYKLVSTDPSISAENVSINYNATSGSIEYSITNSTYDGVLSAVVTEGNWLTLGTVTDNEVPFTCTANEVAARAASVTLTYTYNTNETVTKVVAITQSGADLTITYVPNTGAGSTIVKHYEYGTEVTILNYNHEDLQFTPPTNKSFKNWNTAADGTGTTYSAGATISSINTNYMFYAQWEDIPTYTLVTSIDQLIAGKHYIIASSEDEGSAYAMGYDKGNNRDAVAVAVELNTIEENEDVWDFVISGNVDNYTIYDRYQNGGYLYASSSSSNNLKTSANLTNLGDNYKWRIEIAEGGAATIVAQGSNTRKYLRFNANSKLFSCYAVDGTVQDLVYLYVKNNDTDLEIYSPTTIASGKTVECDTYTVGTNGSLIIANGAQLIANNAVNATVQKEIVGFGNDNSVKTGWYTIASPVTTNIVPADNNMLTNTYDLYYYDEIDAKWYNHKQNNAHSGFNIEPNKGYLYANSENTTLSFAGEVRASNASVNIPLSYTSDLSYEGLRGFNLVGNPFVCNITSTTNAMLGNGSFSTYYIADGTVNAEGNNLIAYTITDRAIKPGEGFFVQATAANQNLVFNGRGRGEQNGYIRILAGDESFTDRAYVQFGGGNELRKMTLADNSTKVYVMQDNKDYAAMIIEEGQNEIPVNFKAAANGNYTMTIDAEGVEMNYLHLIDNMTGMDVDLLQTPSYTFDATTNDYTSRFRLVFSANNVDGPSTGSGTFAFYSNGNWVIGNEGEATLQVIDINGRIVSNETINGTVATSINATPGVYMLRLVNGNEVKTQKIVVK